MSTDTLGLFVPLMKRSLRGFSHLWTRSISLLLIHQWSSSSTMSHHRSLSSSLQRLMAFHITWMEVNLIMVRWGGQKASVTLYCPLGESHFPEAAARGSAPSPPGELCWGRKWGDWTLLQTSQGMMHDKHRGYRLLIAACSLEPVQQCMHDFWLRVMNTFHFILLCSGRAGLRHSTDPRLFQRCFWSRGFPVGH